MNKNQLLHLWEMRFEKLLSQEQESLLLYKVLLKEYDHLLGGSRIKQIIRRIMREEAMHVQAAERLLEIVRAGKLQACDEETSPLLKVK